MVVDGPLYPLEYRELTAEVANALAGQSQQTLCRNEEGDRVVIVAGSPPGVPGSTNALRVHRIGDARNKTTVAYRAGEDGVPEGSAGALPGGMG